MVEHDSLYADDSHMMSCRDGVGQLTLYDSSHSQSLKIVGLHANDVIQ